MLRAKEGGVRTLESNVALLALPRPGEALAMKDQGYPAQTAEEGYELKAEEVQLKLHPLGLASLPVVFFNAAEDAPEVLRSFIASRIGVVRDAHRNALREIVNGANSLLANYEKEQTREIIRTAAHRLMTWLDKHADITTPATRRVHESLLSATGSAHWKTIYATVVRKGDWHNLDYAHELSHGARRIATQLIEPKLNAFRTIAQNVLDDDELAEAHDLATQTVRTLDDGFDALVRAVQLVGESVHADVLSEDMDFWREVSGVSGSGYRDRINNYNRDWFEAKHGGEAEARVLTLVTQKWRESIDSVRGLLAQD
ncbi:MAG: hypothetical protein ABI216_17025 [Devosia sp.]